MEREEFAAKNLLNVEMEKKTQRNMIGIHVENTKVGNT
jgi:hypothetical protein